MRREPVCVDKWRGKEIAYLPHFPCRSAQKHQDVRQKRTPKTSVHNYVMSVTKNAIKNGGHRARFCATWMAIIVNI